MEQIQQQISLFHTLFYVCLGICIFCLILSIIFFFKFDIVNIFNARTGRSVKKTVQQVEEMNARMEDIIQPPPASPIAPLSQGGSATEVLGAGTTEVLNQSGPVVTKEMVQQEVDESHGMFRIEKYEMYIHTNEMGERNGEKRKRT
ncbi:MAG: hypothetical protein UGF43_15010 [Blautia sp.]|mgnify:FL=1|uniref:hypothetical protein n=1 Tax=Blautia sp. TaxID=1955243 RepID=UPI002E78FEE2|nr:hypothetical protein [Blautia sp.]MEE1444899.1 hypothetical protein [Blautia sp.]